MAHDSTGHAAAALPSITDLLGSRDAVAGTARFGHRAVVEALRGVVARARADVLAGGAAPDRDDLVLEALAVLDAARRGRTRPVVNATGVLLHTNLGRAPLADEAVDAMAAAAGYATLEYDLADGRRGGRGAYARSLAAGLCDAEDAALVNNGAAALVLVLAALSGGRETVVSRGELIEIGGSFRLPDVMAASGARLHEVGTTNRTRTADYEAAVGPATAVLLRVHPSNYRVVGFTERPAVADLAALARTTAIPLVVDLGSGRLRGGADVLGDEPAAADTLAAGADLVIFSGDKLLGGPQAGIIAGRAELVHRCRRHPLARALRLDKFRLAALEATLEAHTRGQPTPTDRMITVSAEDLRVRAEEVAARVGGTAIETAAVIGGGSLPEITLPSWAVAVDGDAERVLAALRAGTPPVVGRVHDGRPVVDLRTVAPDDDDLLASALAEAVAPARREPHA